METKGDILYIEDEIFLQEVVSDFLKSAGYNCRTTTTVEGSIRLLKSRLPDFIITDYNLPDGTALDVLKYIAENAPSLQAVVITAADQTQLQEISQYRQVLRLLAKPVTPEKILKSIPTLSSKLKPRRIICDEERDLLLGDLFNEEEGL